MVLYFYYRLSTYKVFVYISEYIVLLQLHVLGEELSMLIGMGYGQKAAKRALRMNRQDVEHAVNFLIEEKAKKQQKLEDEIRQRNKIM